MGRYIKHIGCKKCGSSDGNAVYEDGSTYCFVCGTSSGGKPEAMSERDWTGSLQQIAQLPMANMLARGIDQATAQKLGIRTEYDGTRNEVAYYFPLYDKTHTLLGYQRKVAKGPGLRGKKDTARVGNTSGNLPFGAQLWSGKGFIIVVEGGEDTAAAIQMLAAKGKNYRVVGTMGADSWKRNLEYFEQFEKVVIAFDMNDEGREKADEFALALTPGKAYMMKWQPELGDDPNALLVNGKGEVWWEALNNAKLYEADGIITGREVWERMENYVEPPGVLYPPEFVMLGEKLKRLRMGEVSVWTAGSGIGKTSLIRRCKQHIILTQPEWKQGEVELEERGEKTWRGLMQFHAGVRWQHMTPEQRRQAWEQTYGTERIFTVDNGRAAKSRKGGLIGKFKHLHYSKGVRVFWFDHVTLGVREFGSRDGSLNDQDQMMEEVLDFAESTYSHVAMISHLRKSPSGGESWSTGAVPTEEDMKGSGSLYQITADIVGVSRNKQHQDEYERNVSHLHVLKNREDGDTGPADRLHWNHLNSRFEKALDMIPPPDQDDGAPI